MPPAVETELLLAACFVAVPVLYLAWYLGIPLCRALTAVTFARITGSLRYRFVAVPSLAGPAGIHGLAGTDVFGLI